MKGEGLPFNGFTEEEAKDVDIIVSDVDDTITSRGKLLPEALSALWDAKHAGKMIVLVTGGSAGWADAYIRQWPVDLVIAEGGAVALAHGKDGSIVYKFNPHILPDVKKKRENLLRATAGLSLSSDQYARLHDSSYIMYMNMLFNMQYPSVVMKAVYFGDSLNDEDMFRLFPLSVGMHSVEDSRDRFDILPKYITSGYGGEGFSEGIRSLLSFIS